MLDIKKKKRQVFGFSFYYAKAKTTVLPCVTSPWFILLGSCALEPRGGDGKGRPPGAPLGRTGDKCGVKGEHCGDAYRHYRHHTTGVGTGVLLGKGMAGSGVESNLC